MTLAIASPPIIIMGVCGSGKSVLGAALADELNCHFVEADDFHSTINRSKMAQGNPLTDADRLPWLDAVSKAAFISRQKEVGPVIACSALRRSYRDILNTHLNNALFVHLIGNYALLAERLAARQNHFVGAALLDSQLAVLEPLAADEYGFTLDCNQTLADLLQSIRNHLEAVNNDGPTTNLKAFTRVGT